MISGKQLLAVLIGAALGAGGWMYGLQNRPEHSSSYLEALDDQLRIAQEELALLERENASLRSLTQGGGELAVPAELIGLVEKDFGLSFLSSPVFHQIASEELEYRIEAAVESRMGPQGIEDREEAYKWIGWLGKEDKLLHQLVAVKSVGVLGWFDEGTGEAWVTDKFDVKNVPDQATMLRLLTRILLEQHFPAGSSYPGDDAARAREALHAGAAAGSEARYYALNAQEIGFVPLNDNSVAARLLLALPEFTQGVTMFPTIEGKGLADGLFVKGTKELAEGFRKPPESTYEVVLPGESRKGKKWEFGMIEDEIYLEESAGYLGVRLWVGEMGDHAEAEEIARGWVGDGYALFADGEMSSALLWEVELESEELAARFEEVALMRVAAMSGLEEAEAGKVYASGERFLGVVRISPTMLRFLNVAEEVTAEGLLKGS